MPTPRAPSAGCEEPPWWSRVRCRIRPLRFGDHRFVVCLARKSKARHPGNVRGHDHDHGSGRCQSDSGRPLPDELSRHGPAQNGVPGRVFLGGRGLPLLERPDSLRPAAGHSRSVHRQRPLGHHRVPPLRSQPAASHGRRVPPLRGVRGGVDQRLLVAHERALRSPFGEAEYEPDRRRRDHRRPTRWHSRRAHRRHLAARRHAPGPRRPAVRDRRRDLLAVPGHRARAHSVRRGRADPHPHRGPTHREVDPVPAESRGARLSRRNRCGAARLPPQVAGLRGARRRAVVAALLRPLLHGALAPDRVGPDGPVAPHLGDVRAWHARPPSFPEPW